LSGEWVPSAKSQALPKVWRRSGCTTRRAGDERPGGGELDAFRVKALLDFPIQIGQSGQLLPAAHDVFRAVQKHAELGRPVADLRRAGEDLAENPCCGGALFAPPALWRAAGMRRRKPAAVQDIP